MNILDIPTYLDSLEHEKLVRNSAFLPGLERIGEFRVRAMTLRQYIALRTVGNPILEGRNPSAQELIAFLWVLSPEYEAEGVRGRRRFVKQSRLLPPALPWLHTRRAMRRFERRFTKWAEHFGATWAAVLQYVANAMMDAPPEMRGCGFSAPFYSEAASVCGHLGREYGWTADYTLNLPLKAIWQFFKEIKREKNPNIPLCNPSDRITAEYTAQLSARLGDN